MKIVIVGGGFAGLKLARSLNNKKDIEALLIDKLNYHQFQPLLYQVATAGLDASNISFPLRKAFHNSKNIRIRLGEVLKIHAEVKQIETTAGNFSFDALVLATGADTNFFGNENLIKHAFPMKSTVEALQLRHRLNEVFESYLKTNDTAEKQRLLTMVVVGGGATGVEVSGTLAEMKTHVLPKDYPEIDFTGMKIILLEGGDRILAAMSADSSRQSKLYLEELGVDVRLNTLVKDYDGAEVSLVNGDTIGSSTVIWAAGIKGNVPEGIAKELIMRGNRIQVNRFSQVLGSENIYALGDVAYMETPKYPKGHPQVATVAIAQGKILAKNLMKISQGQTDLEPFEYFDKGSMATVGRHRAVVDIPKPKLHFGGSFAWYIWMGLHLLLILGVKNRIQVFVNWVYKYFTYDQSLRLWFKGVEREKVMSK